ncbi:sigma 54-interacting transcriptional regulator [Clostridium sp. YIM B02506]|uniref:sigma-54 interaction domain-containing protein n=1 Tax=Clostridium sp. YIM B02506 TaxID=2910680 RepID=UPI001EEF728D
MNERELIGINNEIDKITEDGIDFRQEELGITQILDEISDGIYLADKNGIVTSVNKNYTKITGIEPDEVIGRYMQEVLNERYLSDEYVILNNEDLQDKEIKDNREENESYVTEKPLAICKMVLEQKKEISIIGTLVRKNDRKIVHFKGKPYFNNFGEVNYVLVVIREMEDFINLKKKLQDIERKSKRYLDELIYLRNNQKEDNMIAKDASMKRIIQLINSVAKTDATILITGETGVGKEVIATEIYKKSNRSNKAYIKINCAAIPESLLESEMFGYEKGAFTGAIKKEKLGYFELAQKGTLLLDEIGEMPMKLQSKLLRVLQEKEITRIGGTKPINLDVRIIAATNQNLEQQIKNGTFREDVYYRLNVIPIEIPPLRERKDDISILADTFLNKFNLKYNKNKKIEASVLEVLEEYNWPGNVRELENLLERLVIYGDDEIINKENINNILRKNEFSQYLVEREEITLKEAVDLLEKDIIEKTLKKYRSSRKAAKVLGVTQPTVLRKAKSLGIKDW